MIQENKIKILQKCLILNKGKILLLQRNRKDSLGGFWDLPGGNLKHLEKMDLGIKREIEEETGLKIDKIRKIGMKEVIIKEKKKHFLVFIYLTRSRSNKIILSKEHQDYTWIKKNEFFKMKISPLLILTKKQIKGALR